MLPVFILIVTSSKAIFIPILKWLLVGRYREGHWDLFGFDYVRWIALEALLFEAPGPG